ncbi:hypothetical protein ONZ45_g12402 [Pleurotus djamor]|nr:hypothetical protein ONZ45_g12402 [Pleurotus djamor]
MLGSSLYILVHIVLDAVAFFLILMGLISHYIFPLCRPPVDQGYCAVLARFQDVPIAFQVLLGGSEQFMPTISSPTTKFDFEDVHVSTRELLPIIESSSLGSRSELSTLLASASQDVVDLRRNLQDVQSTILFNSERIVAAIDSASEVASRQWIKPNGIICMALGAMFLSNKCLYNHDVEEAVILDLQNAVDASTWPILSTVNMVMQTLEKFDQRLLTIHRIALSDGLHLNAVGNTERQTFTRNAGILQQTERYVVETTGFAFSAIRLVEGIHSHTIKVQQFSVISVSHFAPIRAYAEKLRDVSQAKDERGIFV